MNKEIAHITYARVGLSSAEKMWHIAGLLPPIFSRCRRFAEHTTASAQTQLTDPSDVRIRFLVSIPDYWIFSKAESGDRMAEFFGSRE
jgi:hypothetical protein